MNKPKRILFLDLMRVIALFMMIQGHTTYDFLDVEIRDGQSIGIKIWTSLRGYTAPFFMMVSGAVFTFLMLSQEKADGSNPRIKAGSKRIITLLFWGYFLNFPIYVIWKVFINEGLQQIKVVGIVETLFTILWISVSLFIYKTLQDENDKKRKKVIKKIFSEGALKNPRYRDTIFNIKNLKREELKNKLFKSVFYSIIISIPYLIISNLMTLEEIQRALRVDVLHIIALGLLSIMLFYYISRHNIWIFSTLIFIMLLFIISIYPIVNKVDFIDLPVFLAPFLNSFDTKTIFPLTPWLAYVFAGSLLGIWLNYEIKKDNFEKIIGFKLLALGLGFMILTLIGDNLEVYLYGKSYYWFDSPNLIYHRIGIVLLVGSFMSFLSLYVTDLPKFLKQMSRNTLWLYVGHLIIIYQIVKPIIGYETRFSVGITITFVIIMFILMYLQTQIIVFVQKKNGYVNFIKSLLTNASASK